MVVNSFLYFFGYSIVLVHLVKHVTSVGILRDGGLTISIMGLSNLLGRIVLGVVCYFEGFKSEIIYMTCMVASGMAALIVPFLSSAWSIFLLCVFFGFVSACLGPILPDIVERICGKNNLAVGYGSLFVLQAAGSALGPPAAGLLRDHYHSYDLSFYLAGAMMILSGVAAVWPLVVRQSKDVKNAIRANKYLAETPPLT